ncbi:sororin-B-like [Ptychodera flava]|uniref:sororin-B-like n=1 Tax=Ptychodera flava TaxID=63121 RepID=UPI003969D35F
MALHDVIGVLRSMRGLFKLGSHFGSKSAFWVFVRENLTFVCPISLKLNSYRYKTKDVTFKRMPPKARSKVKSSKRNAGMKTPRGHESSSDEKDPYSAKVVLHRLSSKRFSVKSSTDTEVDVYDFKENDKYLSTDPYDGDMENSSEVYSQSDGMRSLSQSSLSSPSSQEMDHDRRKILSPTRGQSFKSNKESSSTGKQKYKKTYSSSRKSSNSSISQQPSQNDSGMFMSPDVQRIMRLCASDASTPSSTVKEKPVEESLFGFESLMTPEPLPFSPVHPTSPTSFTSLSTASSSGVYSMTQNSTTGFSNPSMSPVKRKSGQGVFDIPIERPAKRIRKKKISAKQKVDIEDWTAKINAQFDDIEMHELLVE